MHETPAHRLGWYLWLLLVVLSPASTKLAGAAWAMAIVSSFWLAYRYPKLAAETAAAQVLYRATTMILWCFAFAFLVRTLGQIYWWDNWTYRHFDVRLFFTAIALHIAVRRLALSSKMRTELIIALALTSFSALYVATLMMSGQSTPTTIIPWAYGMALFATVLACVRVATEATSIKSAIFINWLATSGALLLLTAILTSGVRGAYFAVFWVCCIILFSLRRVISARHFKNKYLWLACLVVTISMGVLIKAAPQVYEIPKTRIAIALAEIDSFKDNQRNTSVGLRLHFTEKGIAAYLQKPVLGYGIEQREKLVSQWGVEVDPTLAHMTHTHNEYLNAVIDYGILGGLATLAFLVGLLLAAITLWRTNIALSLVMAGFCFATLTTFLTNANSLHNYTSVSLGLALIFSVLLYSNRQGCCPHQQQKP